ncbi:unnamed protein product [Brassica rapa subsp. narinosa]
MRIDEHISSDFVDRPRVFVDCSLFLLISSVCTFKLLSSIFSPIASFSKAEKFVCSLRTNSILNYVQSLGTNSIHILGSLFNRNIHTPICLGFIKHYFSFFM